MICNPTCYSYGNEQLSNGEECEVAVRAELELAHILDCNSIHISRTVRKIIIPNNDFFNFNSRTKPNGSASIV